MRQSTSTSIRWMNAGMALVFLLIGVALALWGWGQIPWESENLYSFLWPFVMVAVGFLGLLHALCSAIVALMIGAPSSRSALYALSVYNMIAFPVGTYVGYRTMKFLSDSKATDGNSPSQ